jgi:hypothetical protein
MSSFNQLASAKASLRLKLGILKKLNTNVERVPFYSSGCHVTDFGRDQVSGLRRSVLFSAIISLGQ